MILQNTEVRGNRLLIDRDELTLQLNVCLDVQNKAMNENDVDQKWLEEKIEEAAMAHERAQRHQERLLRPYLTARRMRKRDF